ncbi:MAG: phosphomannomutase/phosphoglucomutase [Chloroflexi bacterium]|nr:phosphomannomutase/phosphoglucomutase [Chloroflexota bacterium]
MNPSIFRAYSIRGIAGDSLTVQDMALIGGAIGTLLGEANMPDVVVGRDYCLSSPLLAAALREGLLATGMEVIDIGSCPTPLLNFATDHYRAGAGLMVTASHNPPNHNGLKIRTDHTVQGPELQRIYRTAVSGPLRQGCGRLHCAQPTAAYLEAIRTRVKIARSLKVVVDAGNGAAGPIVLPLLEMLGCDAIPLYCDPDGRFPNRVPDPAAPGALSALSTRVIAEGADAGLAYDGDGDRLVMVDERGGRILGDRLLALLARDALATRRGARIVYELSCTQAVPETVSSMGGEPISCPVGYAFVHETMRKAGAIMGGEAAGHLFFDDPGFGFDDAMLATAKMLSLLSRSEQPLSSMLDALPRYCSSPEHRLQCPDDLKRAVVAAVREQFSGQGYKLESTDGVKAHFGDGWGLFRASNTQPAVTLHCEARSAARVADIEHIMLSAARQALTRAGVPPT